MKDTKVKRVNEKSLIVGIDIARVKNYGYFRCPDGTETKPFAFINNRAGFDKLWGCICKSMRHYGLKEIIVGFESTGTYAEPLLHFLRKKKVRLVQVNPMHTKRLKELQGNSPNKTDQKDPKVIVDIIELGHALTVIIPEGSVAELRRLTQARERASERYKATLNQLHSQIFILFPEFLEVMRGVNTATAQYILEHYPTPCDIVRFGLGALTLVMRNRSRGRLSKKRAEELLHAAKNSIGIQQGQASILFDIKHLLELIKYSKNHINDLEKKMFVYLDNISYANSILSIKGIGKVTAAGLIGEVGDFAKFNTISEVMKLAGLDLFEISSGGRKGQRRISKRGRPLIRKLLFFAAINVVRDGGIMHKRYQKYLQRGMPKMKAIITISRKLLVVIFALVRNHSEYINNYEEIKLKKAA